MAFAGQRVLPAIKDEEEGMTQVAVKLTEAGRQVRRIEVVGVEAKVEPQTTAPWGVRQYFNWSGCRLTSMGLLPDNPERSRTLGRNS